MTTSLFECSNCGEKHSIGPAEMKFECICLHITLFPKLLWQGPGPYQHYKSGLYIAFGKAKLEYNNRVHVAYQTLTPASERDEWYSDMFCIFRPLNEEDGPDCWNSFVIPTGMTEISNTDLSMAESWVKRLAVPRFKKVSF